MPRIMAILFLSLSTVNQTTLNECDVCFDAWRRICLTLVLILAIAKVGQLSHLIYWHCGRHSERHPSLP